MLLLGSKRSSLSSMLRSSLGQHDVCAACVAAAKVHIQSNVRADADNHAAVTAGMLQLCPVLGTSPTWSSFACTIALRMAAATNA
jgi:hypothetical protein